MLLGGKDAKDTSKSLQRMRQLMGENVHPRVEFKHQYKRVRSNTNVPHVLNKSINNNNSLSTKK